MGIPFFYHTDFASYDFGPSHPFQGSRFDRFMQELAERFPAVFARLDIMQPQPAGNELLELVHDRSYIDRVIALEKRRGYLSVDTQLLPGSIDAARLIVGASTAAAREALRTGLALGFGGLHHAGPDYGEGFCIFNDVAVAAAALLKDGKDRILILDTDAHQGNGTMDVFIEDPRVLFISLHQDPRTLYPGRGYADEVGEGAGKGYTVNIPMPTLSGGSMYDLALDEIVFPLIDAFKPEIIIRNGGSDPLYTDTLTNLGLTLDDLSRLMRRIAEKAKAANVPLVDLFLSGYGPYVTEGWLAILRGTLGESFELSLPEQMKFIPPEDRARIERVTRAMIEYLRANLRPYWSIF
ncbi:MAG: histone deacetylase family protein [Candidatus Krumholzibacteria bacterium]|nr:histone deacetylase family protein [Candidatus Krumholzibacteria bacterium]